MTKKEIGFVDVIISPHISSWSFMMPRVALSLLCCFISCALCWLTGRSPADAHDPGALFIQTEVQDILQRVTGFDLDKIFHERPAKNLQPTKYHLLTEKQLQEVGNDTVGWPVTIQ